MIKTYVRIAIPLALLGRALFAQTDTPDVASDSHLSALVGGTLIDGTGNKPIFNSVILIRGERIEKIGTVGALPVPAGYRMISTEGMTVLPGLWDMHTHLQYSAHADLNHWNNTYFPEMEEVIMPAIASQLLMAGVTSARDPMAPTDQILSVKKKIARGEIPGPTMYVSGALLEHKPPKGTEVWRKYVGRQRCRPY
jgi:imidazolonepropionase-like amidohydrolase